MDASEGDVASVQSHLLQVVCELLDFLGLFKRVVSGDQRGALNCHMKVRMIRLEGASMDYLDRDGIWFGHVKETYYKVSPCEHSLFHRRHDSGRIELERPVAGVAPGRA